jgi:hypothetical protein
MENKEQREFEAKVVATTKALMRAADQNEEGPVLLAAHTAIAKALVVESSRVEVVISMAGVFINMALSMSKSLGVEPGEFGKMFTEYTGVDVVVFDRRGQTQNNNTREDA